MPMEKAMLRKAMLRSPGILAGATALALMTTSGCGVRSSEGRIPPQDTTAAADPVVAQGSFRPAEAAVSGGFRITGGMGRSKLVLTSDFRTSPSAPDLKVVFSPSATPLASSPPPNYPLEPGTYTILAPLTSASGAQSYAIPASIDLKKQGSVLIWCEKFNATMAWAPIPS